MMTRLLEKYLLHETAREGEGAGGGSAPAGGSPASTSSPEPGSNSNPSPAVEPAAPAVGDGAAGPVSDSGAAADAGASGASGAASPTPPAAKVEVKPKVKDDWRDKRIAKLTGQLNELKEKVQASPPAAAPTPAAPLDPTADFNARVAAAAQQVAAVNSFNEKCNAEATKGRKQWADFDERLADVRALVNPQDVNEVAQYNALLQAGLETGELATLMYELGQDLDEASRILTLSPLRMGVELTKRALKGPQIGEVSQVAQPVRPLSGGRGDQVPIDPTNPDQADNLTTAEWMKRREAQIASRGAR